MRIVTAMSGGVDSSVAAALLAEQGHEVIGLSMQLYDQREGGADFGSCCSIDDLEDARRVASLLRIPHYIVNFEKQFDAQVISPFVREYTMARTPIPCVQCNGGLKFTNLLERAKGFDAGYVSTGHYARVSCGPNGLYRLRRGLDRGKDQSYFLFTLTQSQLACANFPLGELRKSEVRAYAVARGLPVAAKPDSHEICFVPDGNYADFVERRTSNNIQPGPIVNTDGQVIGQHAGIHRYTVGQRKGLGISNPEPLYVVALSAVSRTVTVGPRTAIERKSLEASTINWISGSPPDDLTRVTAQIRHHQSEATATLHLKDASTASLEFDLTQPAISPGQAAVFYDGDVVLGGGWID